MSPMLSRLLKALFGGAVSYITDWLDGKANEKVITAEQTTLDQKSAEAKADLARLNEQNVLKTSISTGIQSAEAKLAEDDKTVKDAAVNVQKAVDAQKAIPKPTKDVTADELTAKLKDL